VTDQPGAWARVTGRGALPGGGQLTWTVADGSRGRRWRGAATGSDGRLVHGLLLEISPGGRLERAEITAATGLLTLHPAHDGSAMHGNCARDRGVDHVALPWGPTFVLLFGASPLTAAVAAVALAARIGVGEGASVPVIEVAPDLSVRHATWRMARVGAQRWRMLAAGGGPGISVEVDGRGLPLLNGGATWPMESPGPG
jgi:hypothetical protein